MGRAANNVDVTNIGGIPSIYLRIIRLILYEEVAMLFLKDDWKIVVINA